MYQTFISRLKLIVPDSANLVSDLGSAYILLPMPSGTNHSLSEYFHKKQPQPKITQFGLGKAIYPIYEHLLKRSDTGWPVLGLILEATLVASAASKGN